MKKLVPALLLATLASTASAKDKPMPLSEALAPTLAGKSLAVVRHPVPSFSAMSPGKAAFGLVGAAAMISAGNNIIEGNHVEDPAALLERELAPAIAKKYGMELKEAPAYAVTQKKAEQIAAVESGVDYALDIRTGGWMFAYYPMSWSKYWVMYSVQVQMIDVKSGKLVSNLACNAGNKGDKHPPSHDELIANGAQLLKDVTQGFGWTCATLLAKEQFHLAEGELNAIPNQFVDVLGQFASAKTGAPVAPTATAAAPAAEAPVTEVAEAPVADTVATEAPTAAAPATDAPAAEAVKSEGSAPAEAASAPAPAL